MPGENKDGLSSKLGGLNRDIGLAKQANLEQKRMDNPGMRRSSDSSISVGGNNYTNSSVIDAIAKNRANRNRMVNSTNKTANASSRLSEKLKKKAASTALQAAGVPKIVSDKIVDKAADSEILNKAQQRSFLGMLKSALGGIFSGGETDSEKAAQEDEEKNKVEDVSVKIPKPMIKWIIIGVCSMFLPLLLVLIPGAYVYNEIAGDSAVDDATTDQKMNDGDSSWWEDTLEKTLE